MIDETRLRERLRAVDDPALGGDIVSLGLIDDLRVTDDGVAEITLAFNAPYAPDEMAMGDRIREVVGELGLETSLSVSLSWQDPDSPLPDVRNVIAVASGKGGVGKTTVATNLATALSEAGARVGLLDGDIYGPNVPGMIGIEGEPGLTEEGTLVPPEAYGVKVISMAFLTKEESDPAMLRGPMIDQILTQLIDDVEWGGLDYLVVDLPPGTGDAQLTLMQTVPVTGAVVVTTPENIALEDVRKGIRMFHEQETPVLGIVENMSTFRCPSCGDNHDLYGSGGGRRLANEYDVPLLGEIPMDPEIRTTNDTAGPVAVLTESPAAEPLMRLSEAVTNRTGAVNRAAVAGIDPDGSAESIDTPSDEYLNAGAKKAEESTAERPDETSTEPTEETQTTEEGDDETQSQSESMGGLDISESG